MREYYGELIDCHKYIEDKNHKAIPLKNYAFSFELHNSTNYTLILKGVYDSFYCIATVKPKEKIQIQANKWGEARIFVSAKEDSSLECNFYIESGCMVKRNLVEHMEGKDYIAPVFKNGIVTIVTCDNCGGPNLGEKPHYKISPLKEPYKKVKVCNFTPYDLVISIENAVVQIIKAKKRQNDKCSSAFVGIPLDGIIYVDTVFEEIAWKDVYNIHEDAILRVNGCCIKIDNGNCVKYGYVIGPVLSEPYIRHLYVSLGKYPEDEGDIEIYCNTIDYRFD